jgi:hypothetical protein
MNKYSWVLQEYSQQANSGVFTTKKAALAAARNYYTDKGKLFCQKLTPRIYRLIDKGNKDDGYEGIMFTLERLQTNVLYAS